jgi:hypothetical protein
MPHMRKYRSEPDEDACFTLWQDTAGQLWQLDRDAYEAKYSMRHGTPVWPLHPRKPFAWTQFATNPTRWQFDS